MDIVLTDMVKLGIFGTAHLGIFLNRALVTPHVKSEKARKVINNIEHVISYATRPLGLEVGFKYLGSTPEEAIMQAKLATVGFAIGGDLIIPMVEAKKQGLPVYKAPQWDQLASNAAGSFYYLAFV